MNSKLCILLVIALCLTLVHAGGKYCPEPKRKGPCHMRYKDNQCCKQSDCPSQSTCCKTAVRQRLLERVTCKDQRSSSEGWRTLRA
uniref:U21-Sparatoxin-Hju1o_1 n=1 Tax=Heteropoda jugulans TaxID=1358901 RepID=A0A4V6MK76_9ARAC